MSRQSRTLTATNSGGRFAPGRLVRIALAVVLVVVLGQVVRGLSEEPGGLTVEANENVAETGVSHPVTAVLLDFRAYDTFLEIGVLLLAALGVLAVRRESDLQTSRTMEPSALYCDPVLGWLVRLLAPLLVLAGGYLLWLGSFAPGGAFQAGAMLAAGGVALRMSGHPSVAAFSRRWLTWLLLAGFIVFLILAIATLLFQDNLFQLPERGAGTIILLVETALTVSIAVTLVTLFVGAKTSYQGDDASRPEQSP